MPPRRKEPQELLVEQVPLPKKHHTSTLDPREPMNVGVTGVASPISADKNEKRTAEDLSTKYARALVAYNGNIEKALAKVFNISEEDALMNMAELHNKARASSRINANATDMMERHDLTSEVRMAKLREHMFSPIPAVSLKAIDAISELDATAKAKRIGTSWETFVARVRAGAGPKARALASSKKDKAIQQE
jgi:hypothetical protein